MLNISQGFTLFSGVNIQFRRGRCSRSASKRPMWIIEMIGSIPKRVHFQTLHTILRYLIEKPVDDQAALDATLAVKNEDDFLILLVEKRFFD
jgi:hypothetical protein